MKEFVKKLPLSPIQISQYLYLIYILLFFVELLVNFNWGRGSQISFTVRLVAMTVQWICLLIALPLVIVGQEQWSGRAALALIASLLLIISMLIDFYRSLLAWVGIVLLLSMLLENLIPRGWDFFARSYREISQEVDKGSIEKDGV